MQRFSASELLALWERGTHQSPSVRGLILLAAACPHTPSDTLAYLPIGVRDARLLALREAQFGPKLTCLVDCPQCKERLELDFATGEIQIGQASVYDTPEIAECPAGVERIEADGYEVIFRLPNSADLIALENASVLFELEHQLLSRCVLSARKDGRDVGVDQLPTELLGVLDRRMGKVDPQAEVKLSLKCPTCTNLWLSTFDIVSYLWMEIDVCARRLLRDVHALASAYGWREADILAMTATRRRAYLDVLRA